MESPMLFKLFKYKDSSFYKFKKLIVATLSMLRKLSLKLLRDHSQLAGFVGINELVHPQGFNSIADKVKMKCDTMKERILERKEGNTKNGLETLKGFDDISNTLCIVIDAAELCRNVHPDQEFRDAADECITSLSDYMQQLNTHVGLYESLHVIHKNNHDFSGIFVPNGIASSMVRGATTCDETFGG